MELMARADYLVGVQLLAMQQFQALPHVSASVDKRAVGVVYYAADACTAEAPESQVETPLQCPLDFTFFFDILQVRPCLCNPL